VRYFQAVIAKQQKQIESLSAGLQKVNDQVQLKQQTTQVAAK